jgi:HSP20 family molecular chaperone IbpA
MAGFMYNIVAKKTPVKVVDEIQAKDDQGQIRMSGEGSMAETTKELQKKEAQVPERVERIRASRVFSPQVDIVQKKEEIVVTADMPGVDEKSVDINLEKNILTIFEAVEKDDLLAKHHA